MKVISTWMTRLRLRHLRLRAKQFAELSGNQLGTVYPIEIEKGEREKQNVLVLAPHADDETLGAGGAIRFHIEAGDDVRIVLFSDNLASVATGPDKNPMDIITMREREFEQAMQTLGVTSTTILRMSDEEFIRNRTKNTQLDLLLIENQPDVLYLPSLFDNHQDHRVVNIWAANALSHIPHKNVLCRGYEVWTPIPATAALNITPYFDIKQQAIRCYTSQLASIRYDHHIAGLNAYRALTFGKRALYAEAFFEAPAKQYQEYINQYLAS